MPISRRALAALLALAPVAPALARPTGATRTPAGGGDDSTAFAGDLHRRLAPGQDLVASPYSLRSAALLAYAGAAGATAAQMRQVLRLPTWEAFAASTAPASTSPAAADARLPRFETANAIWPARDIALRPAYEALVRRTMGVSVQGLDFSRPEAADIINRWVSDRTHGRIDRLADPADLASARLVLTNAVWFKAYWADPFDPWSTRPGPFRTAPGQTITADLMRKVSRRRYWAGDGLAAVTLDYVGGEYGMTILLPDAVGGLGAIEAGMTPARLGRWLGALDASAPTRVALTLPRFRIDSKLDLRAPLMAMGLTLPFARTADFSRMSAEPLRLDRIIQKAFIVLDEEGTEAAAATEIDAVGTGRSAPPIDMTVDHPFIYLLRDLRDGSVLFMGRVVTPSAGSLPPRRG